MALPQSPCHSTLAARFHDSIDAIDAAAWDALAGEGNPFVSHAFLGGLERCGCIRPEWGWQPHHLTLHRADGSLAAAAPLYLKGNSHGEYVFDWNWAGAWERAGGAYYPKLLCAVPYSPVPGPRLLVGDAGDGVALRAALARAMRERAWSLGLSSVHANFLIEADLDGFDGEWLARFDWQYHWHNRDYGGFDDFLAALRHKKRKNIRQERATVAASGLDCTMQRADALDADELATVHALYLATFDEKGNHATLTLEFFRHLAAQFGEAMQLALARRAGQIVAMALFLRGGDTLYGRYWGSREQVPGLHFELCYYLGIDHAIARRLQRFEPGAQGRHKLARGFLPSRTRSRHAIAPPALRAAVAEALRHEAAALEHVGEELLAHSPYAHGDRAP
ncbi:MAG TPA: GNAT family N-acetyltransferase [Rhodanobacteraceae bacterium]|nr:GNAT family N-acetyltransferase [Rhodanobacteraceae bacterium]